jgi:hypothetical protein
MSDKESPPQGHRREKSPNTVEVSLAHQRDYAEWVKAQRQPTMDDKGELPPDPPEDLHEPHEQWRKTTTQPGKPSKRDVAAALEEGCRAHG